MNWIITAEYEEVILIVNSAGDLYDPPVTITKLKLIVAERIDEE